MFKKIIEKLKFGSCKTKVASDVNAFTESEKKKSEDIEKYMVYHCKHCSFTWDSSVGDIQKLLLHEKTHQKKVTA